MCLLIVAGPKVLAGDSATRQLAEIYKQDPLAATCFTNDKNASGVAAIHDWGDVRLVGEVCAKVVTGAKLLVEMKASSSQIATFFIGSFLHGLFNKYTRKPLNVQPSTAEVPPLEYRE